MADKISEEDLKKEISKILENANLANTSTNKVIQKLEKVFGVELLEKKKTIDKLVMDYVNSKESEEEEDEDDKEEEEEEEVEKKPPKRAAAASRKPAKKRKESTEEDDDDADSDDEDFKKPTKKKGKKKADTKAKKGGGRGKGGGYTRAYKLSPELADLMGTEELPRHEVVKRVWALIKERKLYDPNNKQFAVCDDGLYKVIGTKRFRIFGMMKYLKTHFIDE